MAKDKFDDLPAEFKDAISGMNPQEIKSRMAQIVLNTFDLKEAEENDQDLAEKREAKKYAEEPYKEGYKANNLKLKFCKRVLGDKGAGTDIEQFANDLKKSIKAMKETGITSVTIAPLGNQSTTFDT